MKKMQAAGKSGIGVGSASIVLIFAVLCLTIFSLITYIVANNNKALVDAETALVVGYYEADALAERVLAEIMFDRTRSIAGPPPGEVYGIDVQWVYDEQSGMDTAYFYCPISEAKSLYVHVSPDDVNGSFDILSWRMIDTDEWQSDDSINVWTGD